MNDMTTNENNKEDSQPDTGEIVSYTEMCQLSIIGIDYVNTYLYSEDNEQEEARMIENSLPSDHLRYGLLLVISSLLNQTADGQKTLAKLRKNAVNVFTQTINEEDS